MKKKKFAVYARTKKIVHEGVQTGKGLREFRVNKSLMNINDPAEAKEIEDKYGMKGSQDVYVVEDERYAHAVNGEQWDVKGSQVKTVHHYTFAGSDMDKRGGSERVRVKTKDGYTFVSRAVAIEEGYTIIPTRSRRGRKGAEVTSGNTK